MGADFPLGYYDGPVEPVLDAMVAARLEGAVLDLVPDPADDIARTWPLDAASVKRLCEHMLMSELPLIEVTARDAVGVLVMAHDVGGGQIWVSDRVPADAVERMRAVLETGLSPLEGWPGNDPD